MTAKSIPPGSSPIRVYNMSKILVIQGPNLNLLGQREPNWYGKRTLEELHHELKQQASSLGHELETFQSNSESKIVDYIQAGHKNKIDFILLNAAGLTHTSVSIRDALSAMQIPFIDIHITNIYAREPFRRQSLMSDIALGSIAGLGTAGYGFALQSAHQYLSTPKLV